MLLKDYKVLKPKSAKIQGKYVYHVLASTYDPVKKYNTDKRICIGKKIDEDYMIPNEHFQEYYPDLIMAEVEPPKLSDTLKAGAFILIRKIIESLEMDKLLDSIHKENKNLIVDLISYMIVNESSTYQHFPNFMRNHLLAGNIVSDSTVSRLLKNDITKKDIELFLKAWNQLHCESEGIYIGYDSTNINTSAKGVSLAEYGKAKDDDELPQVNLSYAIDQSDATPLFYELYAGSIIDNSQCKYMVDKAKEYGYKKVGFLLDRGYFSKSNIQYFDENGYEFIMMVKENSECVKMAIEEVRTKLRNMSGSYIAEHNVCGETVKTKIYSNDKKERYVHVYYDDARASGERLNLLRVYDQYEKELDKKVEKKIAVEGELQKYSKAFNLKYDTNGYLKSYKRKGEFIKKQLDQLGYFVIVTSEEMDARKALDIYRNRDSVEKLFMSLKSGFDYSRMGVHSEESIESKTHVTFLANIVRNEIYQKLKELKKKTARTLQYLRQ